MKRLLVTLATLVFVILSLPLVSFGLNFSGLGTSTIDGVMSPGEWDNAAKVDFQASLPSSEGGGTTPATLYVMNDGLNLYMAVKIKRSSFGFQTNFLVDFDNNNDGIAEIGNDGLQMSIGNYVNLMFGDYYRYVKPGDPVGSDNGWQLDTADTVNMGTSDISAFAKNDGTYTIFELSHLLCSKDSLHDFCLKRGATVGFRATLQLYPLASTATSPKGVKPYAETVIPVAGTAAGSNYGQITLAIPKVPGVSIDIKPGSSRVHTINTKSEGKIPVAILSTDQFNAPKSVDRNSLTFGRTGDERSMAFCNEDPHDVNGDGLPDLICHFSTQLAEFEPGDLFGILNGKTIDGSSFTAKDSVRIVK